MVAKNILVPLSMETKNAIQNLISNIGHWEDLSRMSAAQLLFCKGRCSIKEGFVFVFNKEILN